MIPESQPLTASLTRAVMAAPSSTQPNPTQNRDETRAATPKAGPARGGLSPAACRATYLEVSTRMKKLLGAKKCPNLRRMLGVGQEADLSHKNFTKP